MFEQLSKLNISTTTKEIILYLFAMLMIIIMGSLGYMYLEDWDFFDSFYMTVITFSTVGFSEVHQLSQAGRAFTLLLIFMGVGVTMLLLTNIARLIIFKEITWVFERQNMKEKIKKLTEHTIFCGYSRLSELAIEELNQKAVPLVVIESDLSKIERLKNSEILYVEGDATKEEVLIEAGIKHANKMVSALPKDADNLYVLLSSKELNPAIYIISRAENELGEKRLLKAGASRIISPYRAGAQKISDGLLKPYVTKFLDLASDTSSGDLLMEEIVIPEESPIIGKNLAELDLGKDSHVLIVAIISPKGEMSYNPPTTTTFNQSDALICLGHKNDFVKIEKLIVPS